jgi:uncharacterized protein (DUF305 family)
MKYLAITGVVAAIAVGVLMWGNLGTVEYINKTEVVEKEVDALEQAIKNAQDEKIAEIKAISQKAYDEAYDQEMKKIELEVVKSFNEQLKARQIDLEKQTKEY